MSPYGSFAKVMQITPSHQTDRAHEVGNSPPQQSKGNNSRKKQNGASKYDPRQFGHVGVYCAFARFACRIRASRM
jgi:hypothetical protein